MSSAPRDDDVFTIDRVTGENVVPSKYGLATNGMKSDDSVNAKIVIALRK